MLGRLKIASYCAQDLDLSSQGTLSLNISEIVFNMTQNIHSLLLLYIQGNGFLDRVSLGTLGAHTLAG